MQLIPYNDVAYQILKDSHSLQGRSKTQKVPRNESLRAILKKYYTDVCTIKQTAWRGIADTTIATLRAPTDTRELVCPSTLQDVIKH